MNMKDIREIAVNRGIRPGKLRKVDLVRAVQRAENNPECYMTGTIERCEEHTCLWRDDCR